MRFQDLTHSVSVVSIDNIKQTCETNTSTLIIVIYDMFTHSSNIIAPFKPCILICNKTEIIYIYTHTYTVSKQQKSSFFEIKIKQKQNKSLSKAFSAANK